MIIRWYEEKDKQAVDLLAAKHNLLMPSDGILIIAERTDGSLAGLVNLRAIYSIEPLISEAPTITEKLFENAVRAVRKVGTPILRAVVDKDSPLFDLANRVGFYEIYENKTMIELDVSNVIEKKDKNLIN